MHLIVERWPISISEPRPGEAKIFGFSEEMLPPSLGVTKDVEIIPVRWEGLRYLVDHSASIGALAIVDQKSPFLVFLAIFT